MTQSSRHSRHQKTKRKLSWFALAAFLIYTALAAFFLFNSYKNQFLVLRGLSLLVPVLVLLLLGLGLVLLLLRRANRFNGVILLLGASLLGLGLYAQKKAESVSNRLNQSASYSETLMSVVVPVDSSVTDIKEIETLLAATDSDSSNIERLLAQIKTDQKKDLLVKSATSYQNAYERLLAGEEKAMILNSAYGELLETIHPDYSSKLKTIYSYTVKKDIAKSQGQSKPIGQSDSFNIYISGIDTYGPITSVSRSDVNIIMSVNRSTNQILLTTTPRDSYVPIAGGGNNQYDKLTHAGIYGIDASIKTLENLYDIDINYYARINFTSFLTLIDLLGGIEVYNEQEFSNDSGYYPVGNISLNSEQALSFVRERYHLADGDKDRGRNQNKVIAAIINKLTSIQALTNYTAIVEGIGDSVQTDMPLATMMGLANDQITSGKKYSIVSQALEGTGSTGQLPSYAMPNAGLYMMSIDQNSLDTVKGAIHRTLEGK